MYQARRIGHIPPGAAELERRPRRTGGGKLLAPGVEVVAVCLYAIAVHQPPHRPYPIIQRIAVSTVPALHMEPRRIVAPARGRMPRQHRPRVAVLLQHALAAIHVPRGIPVANPPHPLAQRVVLVGIGRAPYAAGVGERGEGLACSGWHGQSRICGEGCSCQRPATGHDKPLLCNCGTRRTEGNPRRKASSTPSRP